MSESTGPSAEGAPPSQGPNPPAASPTQPSPQMPSGASTTQQLGPQPVPPEWRNSTTPAFWSSTGANNPWRDPQTRPSWQQPPREATPATVGMPPAAPAGRMGWPLITIAVALVAGLLAGLLGYFIADKADDDNEGVLNSSAGRNELAQRPPESIAGIVEQTQPGVVTVAISSAGQEGNGSGFVISDEGHIMTNSHVAEPGRNGELSVIFSDGSTAEAKIVGTDAGSDIAVLKVDKKDLTTLPLGNSDKVRVGDPVVAFGAPLGLSGTVTSGIVSAVDRPVVTGGESDSAVSDESFMAAIQTDAPINPGNSGGALVDGSGRVIGINSAIATAPGSEGSIGLGFAIPINHAKRIAEQLIKEGKAKTTVISATLDRGYQSINGGVRLEAVDSGGAAEAAGLRPGDVIVKFDGRFVEDSVALIALIRKHGAGEKITIEYERDGQRKSTEVTLTDRPS
ncbi:MAG: PDZ domain-containing protein [Corynebacteriales bacterium]|nr:PDZ domain-containing protein [Mycobacteriales bacterium]